MHTLNKIIIENFKSIEKLELNLHVYTPVVGYNNAGKSNIMEAIDWFLTQGRLDENMIRNGSKPAVVTGTITGVSDCLIEELDEKHQKQIGPYIIDGNVTFRLEQQEPGGAKKLRTLTVRDPEIENVDDENAFTTNPSGIPEALSKLFPESIFIRAMENATDDVANNKSTTTIGKLIKQITDPVKVQHEEEIKDAIGSIDSLFSAEGDKRVDSFKEFDRIADENITNFFPGISLKLHVPAPTIDDIFRQGTVKFSEDGEELRDFALLGHGAQRSIQMAMIKMLSEYGLNIDSDSRKFLLIEEPELYLHPKAILVLRNALKKLSKAGYQVLFATHSPLIITKEDIADTILIRKTNDNGTYRLSSVRESVKEVIKENENQADALFELSNSTKLLFADRAILVEGKTELKLLPALYKIISEKEDNQSNVVFIPLSGSGNMINSSTILKTMDLDHLCLVDLDFCFKVACKKGLLGAEDEDIQAILTLFAKFKDEGKYELDNEGLPTKNSLTNTPA
ncbi:ATP-dependent endonuclease [soil metagenome]